MKTLHLLFFISLVTTLSSQNSREFLPSKTNKFTDPRSKIVLNAKTIAFFNARPDDDFKEAKRLEFRGLSDQGLIEKTIKKVLHLNKLEEITFHDCELIYPNFDLITLTNLKSFNLTGTSLFNPDDIIQLLKNTHVTDLSLALDETAEIPDSLALLKNLENFNIVNPEDVKSKAAPTYAVITYTSSAGNVNTINVIRSGFDEISVSEDDYSETELSNTSLAFTNHIIKPPLKGIDINDATYTLDQGSDQVIYYESGTRLYIPRNAFSGTDGEDYRGPVTIFYREFRNPLEQMLSGIPMSNQENNDTNTFISAGMYELWAYNDKKEKLQLKPEKKITIDFKPTTDTGTYRFWSLDTTSGKWSGSKQSVDLSKRFNAFQTSRGVQEFLWERTRLGNNKYDYTKFEDRFYDNNYIGTIHRSNFQFNKDSTKYVLSRFDTDRKYKIRSKYKFNGIRNTKKGDLLFKFTTLRFPDRDFAGGMSLRSLEGKQLKFSGEGMSKQEFRKKYTSSPIFDVRLSESGNSLVLQLKNNKGVLELPFNIVEFNEEAKEFESKPKLEKAIARHFNIRLRSIAKSHNKKNTKHQNAYEYDHNRLSDRATTNAIAYEKAKHYLSKQEKAMKYEMFIRMADSLDALMTMSRSGYAFGNNKLDTMVVSAFGVLINSGLGFNNIDCYLHQGLVNDVYVNYKNPLNDRYMDGGYAVTLVREINTSIAGYNDNKKVKIRYIKGKMFTIMHVDEEGYIQADTFDPSTINSNELTLLLNNRVNVKGKNSDEIAKLIGL